MKILAAALLLIGSFCAPGAAQEVSTAAASASVHAAATAEERMSLADVARTIGLGREEYRYSVEWGVLKVGKATLGATATVVVGSATAYHIVSTARTHSVWDTLHKVRDRNEAWLDTTRFISLGFGKYLREGKFRRDETVVFNHETGRFKATVKKKSGQIVVEEGPMKPYAYDVLSALYWLRAQELAVGKEFAIDVNTRKDWPQIVKINREEKIKVAAGEFECWVVEPMMRDEGIFVQKGKSMNIWFTKDPRKIPVQIKAEVFIGAVRAELEEIVYNE